MKHNQRILFCSLMLLFSMSFESDAQDIMRITQKDGTITDYPISEIRKMTFIQSETTTVEQMALISKAMIRLKAYPNPTANEIKFDYELFSEGPVKLEIYSMNGNRVFQQKVGKLVAGKYNYIWSANRFPQGQYVVRIRQNNQLASEKILVVK